MNYGEIAAYEFYRRDGNGEDHFVGTLPERRKNPERIAEDSITNWARLLLWQMNDEEFKKNVYYVSVKY